MGRVCEQGKHLRLVRPHGTGGSAHCRIPTGYAEASHGPSPGPAHWGSLPLHHLKAVPWGVPGRWEGRDPHTARLGAVTSSRVTGGHVLSMTFLNTLASFVFVPNNLNSEEREFQSTVRFSVPPTGTGRTQSTETRWA